MLRTIVAALGNPGKEYENTYHNAGILALEELFGREAARAGDGAGKAPWKKHQGLFEYAEAGDAVFVRPLTYMNESGRAIRAALKKFGPSHLLSLSSRLIILHDDSDLPLGTFRISVARGPAGHKGVQSVIDALGTGEFVRIRIGIRDPQERVRRKAGDFALKQITKAHRKLLDDVFREIADADPISRYTKTRS
ncbi:MAG TPA: aminoacyl-tRNA hydrolase [Candidatus Paceibacterota bacterium]|nr:aminoacyl-tRNA hydrolase [Candidatus Paceibacterota bacterium]